jgi:hypothetical protein
MKRFFGLAILVSGLATFSASAATLYVSLESTNPVAPYATWATAATNIQDAVDAAKNGDTVLVTNGVYATESREVSAFSDWYTNSTRVVVTNSIKLESVNGPLVTRIEGSQGDWVSVYSREGGVRCVFLGTNTVLCGFTLNNGHADAGGGVWCVSTNAVVTNCVFEGNHAFRGGGAYGGILLNCTFTNNSAYQGGGVSHANVFNCQLLGNYAGGSDSRAGAAGDSCVFHNCVLGGNFTVGGISGMHFVLWNCTLYNCTVANNRGLLEGSFYNCLISDNFSAVQGSLYGCTVVGNAGRVVSGTAFNCILYYNSGGNYGEEWYGEEWSVDMNYCCTTPLPSKGVGNISGPPLFIDMAKGDFRLRPDSPCIDTGTNLSGIITTDIDGEFRPWDGNRDGVAAFDMGAYELRPSPVTLYVSLMSTNPVAPYATWATAANVIQDAVDAAKDGDTVLVTNGVYNKGGRMTETNNMGEVFGYRITVTNAIRLESVHGPLVTTIEGSRILKEENGGVTNGMRCVHLLENTVLSGFTLTNGCGGVTCEQSGVVTNCILTGNLGGSGARGGILYNCILSGNTGKAGGGASRCILYNCTLIGNAANTGCFLCVGGGAYDSTLYNCVLTNNWAEYGGGAGMCVLYSCTLTGNSVEWSGGGAYRCTLYNCTLSCNMTTGGLPGGAGAAGHGGGVFESTLYNCTLSGNLADGDGGGAFGGSLYNCTLSDNSAPNGGGVGWFTIWPGFSAPTLYNCIVYFNSGGNYEEGTILNYCCTTPIPTNGVGNITGPPMFVDLVAGDFRLRQDSPCIDAGTNLVGLVFPNPYHVDLLSYYNSTDILGNTRFIDGNRDGIVAWDIGAYEFNSFKPPRFSGSPQRTAGGWRFIISGEPKKPVELQRTSDFTDWWDLKEPTLIGEDGTCTVVDADTGPTTMFYRAVIP